jgi:hypothetical protein
MESESGLHTAAISGPCNLLLINVAEKLTFTPMPQRGARAAFICANPAALRNIADRIPT